MVEINCARRSGTQVVQASDQSSCLIVNSSTNRQEFHFSFYANFHPSFVIINTENRESYKMTVRTVNCTEQFLVHFD